MARDLEEKVQELSYSRESCQSLEVELRGANKSCSELENAKSQLEATVQKIEEEKQENVEKAEV